MDYVKICCCTFAFILYLNTLGAGFVYDDRRAILNNPDVINTSEPWSQLFYNDFWGTNLTDSGSHCSYRPLTVLTFKINHILGGTNAFGYHLVNVLLHCLATSLVINLGRHILPCEISTLLSGLLFAIHPIHTEAVAGLTGRADLIACIFFILTILSYIKHVQLREKCNVQYYVALLGAIISASAAILCKETAVSALIVCAIYDILKGFKIVFKDKNQLRSLSIIIIVFLITLYLRLTIPRPSTPFSTADNPTAKANALLTRFYTFLYLPVFNFFLLIHPETLSFDWSMDSIARIDTLLDSRNFITLTFYSLLFRLIFVCLWNVNLRSYITKSGNSNNKHYSRMLSRGKTQFQCNENLKSNDTFMKRPIQLVNKEHKCLECNQKYQHADGCYASSSSIEYNAYRKLIISLSPLRKYIKNNSKSMSSVSNLTNNNDNNNNNNNDESELKKDSNNNIIAEINNNNNGNDDDNNNNNNNNVIMTKDDEHTKIVLNSSTITKKALKCVKPPKESENLEKTVSTQISNTEVHTKVNQATATLLSITILVLPFVPATNLVFYVGFVIGERILYLPSVGFCLLIGLGIEKLLNLKKKINSFKRRKSAIKSDFIVCATRVTIITLCVAVFISMSLKTIQRNFDWKNEENLYKSAIHVNPPKALGNLGSVLSSKGHLDIAEVALITALKYRPNMADVHYNLGILYSKQEKYSDAVKSFRKAIYYRPKLTLAYLNLGSSLIALGKHHEAAQVLREGSRLDGTGLRDRREHEYARISSLMVLGQLLTDHGRLQRAIAVYREALATLPPNFSHTTSKEIYHRLGDVFIRLKKIDDDDDKDHKTV